MAQLRVLVIDDEPDLRLIAELSLSQVGGFSVELAASGAEGLVLARRWTPDVILLDAMMPEMDGPATFAKLAADGQLRSIPVIFVTARVEPRDRAQYLELGAAGVLAKPFDPMTLPDQIISLLS
jgi:CheY-like chemotaxis protein